VSVGLSYAYPIILEVHKFNNNNMKKVFNENGDFVIRFAADAKEQIQKWLGENCPYDFAVQFAKEVDCPVFGKALEFPCVWEQVQSKLYEHF